MKLTFCYWNTGRKALVEAVGMLAHECAADVVILLENTATPFDMLGSLNKDGMAYRHHASLFPKAQVYAKLPPDAIRSIRDIPAVSIRQVFHPLGTDLTLVIAHLPSKLHMSDMDQSLLCTRLTGEILAFAADVGHKRTIVVGDLNMNPFEPGVSASEGLHAVSSRSVAAKCSRVVSGEEREFFYNPMWSRFGERFNEPPGTYYYHGSSPHTLFWHVFDHVLIRPALLDAFRDDDLRIITKVAGVSLVRDSGVPNASEFSDHLPLVFKIDVSEGVTNYGDRPLG